MSTEEPAESTAPFPDEVRELRNCVRDLVALSSLRAIWTGRGVSEVAGSLAEAICGAIHADLVYVQLKTAYGDRPSTAVRTGAHDESEERSSEIESKLTPYLSPGEADGPRIVPNPLGGADLRMISLSVGYAAAGGLVAIGSREPGFPDEFDQLLCRVAADQAAAMLFQADLMEQSLRHMRMATVLEERTRLAREIHDTIAQGLIAVALKLQVAERAGSGDCRTQVEEAQQLVQECLEEARRSVEALRPSALDHLSLVNALSRSLNHLTHNSRTEAENLVTGDAYPLPITTESNILRIVEEAVTNTLRHANARIARLTLDYRPDRLIVTIADDGRGFDPNAVNRGFGLTGMRERAEQLQASLTVMSSPEKGTTVELDVPVAEQFAFAQSET